MNHSIICTDGAASPLTVEALTRAYRPLQAQAPQPVGWRIVIPYRAWKEERRAWRMMMLKGPLRVRRRWRMDDSIATENCAHCDTPLTEQEIMVNEQTARIHGIDFRFCRLCWHAWGTMNFGWQAGVPKDQRVSFTERTREWDARRKP